MQIKNRSSKLSPWLYAAALVFSSFTFASAVQLKSQVAAVDAFSCNVYSCASDQDCETRHPLCASCQTDDPIFPNRCSTIVKAGTASGR